MTLHVIKWQTHVLQNRFTLSHVCSHTQQAIHINERSSSASPPPPLRASALFPCTAKDRGLPWMKTYNIHNAHMLHIQPSFAAHLIYAHVAGKKVTHDSEGWRVPPTVGSQAKVSSPGPGHFIALSISRGLRGGWTEVSSYYSWQCNKTAVRPGRARAAKKEPKMRQVVREDLGDGRKQRWRGKKWREGRELQKSAEIKEEGRGVQVIPWVSGNVESLGNETEDKEVVGEISGRIGSEGRSNKYQRPRKQLWHPSTQETWWNYRIVRIFLS